MPATSQVPEEADRPWFDHVGIAVPDLDGPARLLEEGLGGHLLRGGDHLGYGFRSLQYKLRGGVKIELLAPLPGEEGARFRTHVDRFGPGVHHLTFLTEDVAALDQRLNECGWTTSDPNFTVPAWRETYLGPRQGLGVIIQLADTVLDWSKADPDVDFAAIAAGQRQWKDARSVPKSELSG